MEKAAICNLDEILSEERKICLTEKATGIKREIDVTNIPSRVILELTKRESDLKQKAASEDESLFDWMLDISIKICKSSFPEINLDWLIDNMSFLQLTTFLQFVLAPLNDYLEGAVEEAKKKMISRQIQTSSAPRKRNRK